MTPDTENKLHEKLDNALRGITTELGKRGIPYQLKEASPLHGHRPLARAIDSIGSEYLPVEIRAEQGTAMGRVRGKIRVQVGGYGERKQFPERKDGFDFAAIVDAIVDLIKCKKDTRKRDKEESRQKASLEEALARVKGKLGQPIDGVCLFVDYNLHGLNIHLDGLTEERANKVLTAIRKVFAS